MDFTRDDFIIPVMTFCDPADKEVAEDLYIDWHEVLTGHRISKEKTFDAPAKIVGSSSQTHCLCYNTYSWEYWDDFANSNIHAGYTSLAGLEITLYTDFMTKHNLETISSDDHERFLELENKIVSETLKSRQRRKEEKIRSSMKRLEEL